jgi:hypothetical protein
MPPTYVKAYVKRNKNDAADAEAICEAVTRPSMRFVPVKDADQQSILMLHRVRGLLIRQRTMLVNALRAHMAEFGIIAPQGLRLVQDLTKIIADQGERLPALARPILQLVVDQLNDTSARIRDVERVWRNGTGRARSASCWRRFQVSASWVPARSAKPRAIGRPRPVPWPCALVVKNGSMTRAKVARSMPVPVSPTVKRTQVPLWPSTQKNP